MRSAIDQLDVEERNKQVQLIRNIYQLSRRVLVWLGEASADSDRGIAWARRLARGLKTFETRDGNSLQGDRL
jgi:hypothetical protein